MNKTGEQIKSRKNAARRVYLSLRDAVPAGQIIFKSSAIAGFLRDSREYERYGALFIYASAGSEAATRGIITRALAEGKTVALPRITDKTKREMTFIKVDSLDELKKNIFGIEEPAYDEKKIAFTDNALVIAPGVAFSLDGTRIGRGGGFYDRWLAKNKYGFCAGLCFEAQIAESLPFDDTDVKLGALITENGFFYTGAVPLND